MADRRKFLGENNICYKCCDSDAHIFRDCTDIFQCSICRSGRHPDALSSEHRRFEKRPPSNGQGAAKNYGREETEPNGRLSEKSQPTER
ncbi:hypothetical protein DPMN_079488 [Dreissena polymorpha]|uniref:Uncharacterized protein n=1 Tax=Dreissena polymorpha TaxID=45954 RepID=A0A9D4BT10_DREPO|nr:hypothetical protein DPMN_079488 [Dreissena polymorpha]